MPRPGPRRSLGHSRLHLHCQKGKRTGGPEVAPHQYDLFMVDLGCFEDLLRAGRLRLVNDGGSSPGIVRKTRRDVGNASPSPRPSAVLIPASAMSDAGYRAFHRHLPTTVLRSGSPMTPVGFGL